MAAGLSLPVDNLPAFRRGLCRAVEKALQATGGPREPTLSIDGSLRLDEINLELVADLERLAPFGAGNPSLVMAVPNVSVIKQTLIGRDQAHRLLTIQDAEGTTQKVVWWGGADWPVPENRIDLACTLRASNFRGQPEVQVEWIDHHPLVESSPELACPQRILVDHRGQSHPRPFLDALRAAGPLAIWAEGEAQTAIQGMDRFSLPPTPALAIWTTPPGPDELQAVLAKVKPQQVVIFGVDPTFPAPEDFLKRLAGLVKFELNKVNAPRSQTQLSRLAGATAQRVSAVRAGLEWMQARGMVGLVDRLDDTVILEYGVGTSQADSNLLMAQIRLILSETAAYRRFFSSTDLNVLFE